MVDSPTVTALQTGCTQAATPRSRSRTLMLAGAPETSATSAQREPAAKMAGDLPHLPGRAASPRAEVVHLHTSS
jgi:hypothetical protein